MQTETFPQAQPTAPSISLATLRDVLAELKAQEPERGCRWDKAAFIVAFRSIQRFGTGSANWYVESECEADRLYIVSQVLPDRWTCMCKDFEQRGGPCKHALSVILLQACEAREGGTPPPAPIAFPARAYTDADCFELTPLGEAYLAAQEPGPAA